MSGASAALTFEAARHEYRLADGQRVPSVTEILKATGVSVDFDELSGMSDRLGAAINEKRALGQALHADAHSFDDDDLDWKTVDPRVLPYLEAWRTFRENSRLVPFARERRVYSSVYGYAGTFDGIFRDPRGKLILIDIKTSATVEYAARLQVAAYELAWRAEHPDDEPIAERWIAHLTPDHKVPYRILNCTAQPDAWMDGQRFLACVTVYGMQVNRR